MADPTLSICIMHAPESKAPERKTTFERLIRALGGHPYSVVDMAVDWKKPGAARTLIDAQWEMALEHPGSHMVLLNDDVIPCENFVGTLKAAISARPDDIIALTCHHKFAPREADVKGLRWVASRDMLVGQAYVVPRGILEKARAFMREHLILAHRELDVNHPLYLSEEHVFVVWACLHGKRIWHTVPSLVQHDDVPSLMDHGGDWARKVTVPPREPMPDSWDTDAMEIISFVPHAMAHVLKSLRPESWRKFRAVERYYEAIAKELAA